MKQTLILCLAFTIIGLVACRRGGSTTGDQPAQAVQSKGPANSPAQQEASLDPCALVLVPHRGGERVDQEILQTQKDIREITRSDDRHRRIERLGWLYVKKARQSFDAGYYKLAEQCAICLQGKQPESAEAMRLRAYALQSLHRFKEAEPLARQLAEQRGLPFDFGLLGDVLLDQGRLEEAHAAYQKMMDLKPDAHAYTRAAHLFWITGNVTGAIDLLEAATDAASPKDADGAAWIWTRLGQLYFQNGAMESAERAVAAATEFQKDYPPALLLRGRMLLAEGKAAAAVEPLQRAATLNPLPEYGWTLAEALRATYSVNEAEQIEARLRSRGAGDDPRTTALFLATRGEQPERALNLAQAELQERQDVFSHDAVAWALAASGRFDQARLHIAKAMVHGTTDARLFLHAAVIAFKAGHKEEAHEWLTQANELKHMLLPSELNLLAQFQPTDQSSPASSEKLAASLQNFSPAGR